MLGDQVGGYVIKEAAGSGQGGVLYLATHPETGHLALVQRRNETAAAEAFTREAEQIFGVAPHIVERRVSRAGVPVLFAVRDAEAAETGHTRFTNTERIAPQRPRARRSLMLPVVLITAFSAGVLLVWAATRTPASPPDEGMTPPTAPPVEVVKTPEAFSLDAGVDFPEPTKVIVEKAADAGTAKPRTASVAAPCEPDDRWKRTARSVIARLREAASAKSSQHYVAWEATERKLLLRIDAAKSPSDCAAIEAQLDRLIAR